MPDRITELLVNGAWVDISSDVRLGHTITRGRRDWSSRSDPSRCTLSIHNPTGRYSPRNPLSDLYGLIGRNTELRVRVEDYAPTPSLRSTVTTAADRDPSIPVAPPADVVAGDVLLAFQSADATLLEELTEPTPNGVDTAHPWELLASAESFSPALVTKIWHRVATDYEPPSYQFRQGASADAVITIAAIKDAGHALPVVASLLESSPGTTVVTPTTDPVSNNDFELRWVAMTDLTSGAANTWTPPAGFTERSDLQSTTFTTGSLATRPLTSDAATGDHTFTASSSAHDRAHGFTVNVMPDAVRFSGEVSSWPPKWNVAGTDVYTPIEASGILRRLNQGAAPLRSALYRLLSQNEDLVAYWPMEDGPGATQFASGLPGGPPMQFVGSGVQPGASTRGGIGSAPLAVVDTPSSVTAAVPGHTTDEWTVAGLFYFEASPDGIPVLSWKCAGTLPTWDLYHNDALGEVTLSARDGTDTEIVNVGFATAAPVAGRWLYWICAATQNGTGIDYTFGISDGTTNEASIGNVATQTAAAVKSVLVGGVGDSIGHVYVTDAYLPFGVAAEAAMLGYAGESAVDRLVRLCLEEDIYLQVVGESAGSAPMGVQRVATLLDLLNDAAEADMGILYEPRDRLGLAYRTRGSFYNQAAALELDYRGGQIGPPLEGVDDDQAVRNDVTVKRTNGSEARAVLEIGPLSVQPPPHGVGRYDGDTPTLNVETDAQLQQIANWRLHLGTWDDSRYPSVNVILIAPDVAANATLVAQMARLDLGDMLSIGNPPPWLAPDLIELLAEGSTERLGKVEWDITWNASPAGPYRVFVVEGAGNLGRADTLGCTLAEDLTASETAVDVTTPVGPVWGTRDLPYDVEVGGEQMTVTAVSGAGSAQTLTVTRAVNSVEKTHATGAAVSLRRPPRWAL